MSRHRVHVCTSCTAGQPGLLPALQAALAAEGLPLTVAGIDCMSGCTRPATVAFRAEGKTAYLFGDLTEADLPDLVRFARAYLAAPDGTFADARAFGDLRLKALARIPG